jgi:beta-glucosidase
VVADLPTPQTGGAFFGMGSNEIRGEIELRAGVPVAIEVDYPFSLDNRLRGLQIGAAGPVIGDPIEAAVVAARAAEVAIVVIGTDADWETEGEDRTNMSLPGRQDELVSRVAAVNPRTVVVLNTGAAVTMPWVDEVAAVLQIWFPGEEIGNVVADVLLGDVEPGGRLSTTLPKRLEDHPAYAHHPGRDGKAVYAEGQFIGYRWYEREGIEPLFPFGHGLGYTTFDLGAPQVRGQVSDGVTVTVPVTNTGARRGSEVVQCYLEAPAGDPARPQRVLAGFAKVTLDPGESFDVELWLPERSFATWGAAEGWHVVPGTYRLHLGRSSADTAHVVAVAIG